MERLQKYLSRAGIASRRRAELLITSGRVRVNGHVSSVLGNRIDPKKDCVTVDGSLVVMSSVCHWFLMYKPKGVVTTLSDPQKRRTITHFTQQIALRVFPVGRLDFDAEGALLLTDDGETANKLMHPKNQVTRVYLVKVKGKPTALALRRLCDGIQLDGTIARAVRAHICQEGKSNAWIELWVTEGRRHLIKRLCATIGHPVRRLFRPAHAGLSVEGMRPGEVRELTTDEIDRVKSVANGQLYPTPKDLMKCFQY